MKTVIGIDISDESKEEKIPDMQKDFPYIASRAELNHYAGGIVPWHWHKAVEIFYVEHGAVKYYTPHGEYVFPEGSGGMLNTNVLHMTKPVDNNTVQLLHIFDSALVSGKSDSRIDQKYILPLISEGAEMIPLTVGIHEQKVLLDKIREAFCLSEQAFGYEIKLREAMSDIWLDFLKISVTSETSKKQCIHTDTTIKKMMVYVYDHYGEKITITDLSKAVYLSERECYRVFREQLHMTPVEYITEYRLQKACEQLINSSDTVADIACACGWESNSYFGRVFKERMKLTPVEYRQKWQNSYK